ncbi:protein kinase [candidate division TA06 bacterium]|uniref:Protein kinase n=1 Tax=candidate division TA06 bacterium TaxID=2250710 RepID=A0A933IAB5_UNCT6|nr:protein kinase [candidate division TA06 bacterium]
MDLFPGIHLIQNEFKFLSSLRHPNLVQVYNFGKDQASYFYTMELVAGGSLFDRSLKIEAVVDAADQLCLVLEYIYGQDILRLNLKPGTILVSAEGRIKLADFGFAQCYSGQKSLKIFGSPDKFWITVRTIIGDRLKARKLDNQKTEVRIGCAILNRMAQIGMPVSYKVAV